MRTALRALCAATALMIAGGGVAPAAVPAPQLAALSKLETGEWELRGRSAEDGEVRKLCVQDMRQLLQFRHAHNSCKSFVVSDAPSAVTVTYDCAAAGSARTDLRVETPRLVQIQSQGIADSAPFAVALEGRRVGECH